MRAQRQAPATLSDAMTDRTIAVPPQPASAPHSQVAMYASRTGETMRAMPSQLGVGLWRLPCTVRIELRHIARSRGGIGTEILLRDGAVLVDKDAAQISMMTLGRREKAAKPRSAASAIHPL